MSARNGPQPTSLSEWRLVHCHSRPALRSSRLRRAPQQRGRVQGACLSSMVVARCVYAAAAAATATKACPGPPDDGFNTYHLCPLETKSGAWSSAVGRCVAMRWVTGCDRGVCVDPAERDRSSTTPPTAAASFTFLSDRVHSMRDCGRQTYRRACLVLVGRPGRQRYSCMISVMVE